MNESSDGGAISNEQRHFHIAEFSELRSEVGTIVRNSSDNLKYAAATVAAVSVWLATRDKSITVPAIAWWIPLATSLTMASISLASYSQLSIMARYLLKLEDHIGYPGLGWEKELRGDRREGGHVTLRQRIPTFGLLHGLAWTMIFLAAGVVGQTHLGRG